MVTSDTRRPMKTPEILGAVVSSRNRSKADNSGFQNGSHEIIPGTPSKRLKEETR